MLEAQPIVAEFDAPRFRGEFLQCCADIEEHLCSALERLIELGELKKAPYLFGQKFDQVRKCATVPGLWKHKQHAEAVIEELRPYIELRGELGHALMSPARIDGEEGVSWRAPGKRDWTDRRAMTHTEMRQALEKLRRLTNSFLKQPLAGRP